MLDRGALTGEVWLNRNDRSHRPVALPNPRTMRQVLLDHTRKRDPKLSGTRTGLQQRRMVGVLGGQLQTIGKEASGLAAAIAFKDQNAKTTYWPQVHSRDALLAFDGLSAVEVAQIINNDTRDLLGKIRKERAHQQSTSAADDSDVEVREAYGSPSPCRNARCGAGGLARVSTAIRVKRSNVSPRDWQPPG